MAVLLIRLSRQVEDKVELQTARTKRPTIEGEGAEGEETGE